MTDHIETLHQQRQKEIAATAAAFAKLELLVAESDEGEMPEAAAQPIMVAVEKVASVGALSELDSLLTEHLVEVEAPLERSIETAGIAPEVQDAPPTVPAANMTTETVARENALETSMSQEDELTGLEAELLADLVAVAASAQVYAEQSSTVNFGSASPRTQAGSRARSEQNRRAYEKKRAGAKQYEKPSEMTEDERAAHLKKQRAAQREREYAQRKAKRAAAKMKASS